MIPTEKNLAREREAEKLRRKEKRKDILKIDNKLLYNAIKEPTLHAFKIIYFLAHELHDLDIPQDKDGIMKVKVDLRKLLEYTNLTAKAVEQRLEKMQETSIKWTKRDEEGRKLSTTWTSLVPRFKRDFTDNSVTIDLYYDIARMIIDVPNHISGTILNVKDMARIKSKHAIRLLPLLHQINGYDMPKQKTLDLDELNAFFGVKMRTIWEIEKRIIKPLQEELKQQKMGFDYVVKKGYETIKRRGRPKALGITIIPKPTARVQMTLL